MRVRAPLACALAAGVLVLLASGPLLPQDALNARFTQGEIDSQSVGCASCHGMTEAASMHATGTVHIGCRFCHGGDSAVMRPAGSEIGDTSYEQAKTQAHPRPTIPELWAGGSANPVRPWTDWLRESQEYIKFVNPGDLRVAETTCGAANCHPSEVRNVSTSMMTHGGMLWQAALYNNGAIPYKNAVFGESYSPDGTPRRIQTAPMPTPEQKRDFGILPYLDPLPRWEVSQPGNILRVFERGGTARVEIGNPNPKSETGKPDDKLSDRGLGTLLRTDPVFLGLQKTRLLDPILSLPGTNDHPGDFRGSGCTGCHVIYANDRSPVHSGRYAQYGNEGRSAQGDPTIPKDESGHPIRHEFTRSIPTSQCIVCHIHPGTNMVASYLGLIWWDNETDGKQMYPEEQRNPTDEERYRAWLANPEGAAVRGLWSDESFLRRLGSAEFNEQLEHTQFADFHGHGWVFRAVYKRDRKGNLLDAEDRIVTHEDPNKFDKAVHLMDIHLEKGMHCTDCHFQQDNHGNGLIYGETRNAVEIDCIDCHGTINQRATLTTSAAAARSGGSHNLALLRTGTGERRFSWENGKLYQRSSVEPGLQWEVVQVMDTITPGNDHYSEESRLAKTMRKDGTTWGSATSDAAQLAHANERMTCYTCHSSWTTSCFGCHLPMQANLKQPMLHNEGLVTRNWTSYNYDVLRDDIYMLGIDGTATGHRIAPTRSTCAVVVSSQNANRDWLYYQQQTISAEGFSGFGFSTYFPHTVRAKETKTCTSCHVSEQGDNNAWMAQLLMQGTNLVNQIGRFVYVAEGEEGLQAVAVAERDDPAAVFGSDLHAIAYPENYRELVEGHHRELEEADHHAGTVYDLQFRGEYLYAALGENGFRIYDIANIENKNFSERITTAPSSPLGQRFYVKTKNATAIASPSTLAVDPLRNRIPENEEQAIALMYGFLYVTDAEEGLIVVGDPDLNSPSPGVLTLLDGDPRNNFLKRAATFNPNGVLTGARRITIAGTYAYILTPRGLVVVDISNPVQPAVTQEIGAPLAEPTGVAVQFRYAFVTDREGLKVLDTTDLAHPRIVQGARVSLEDARNVYVARTYAYVSGGRQGLVIVDVEQPEQPRIEEVFSAEGEIHDLNDVKIGMTNASAFAYLADGEGGMKIVQLFAPTDNPNYLGFSPKPTPKLIATYHTHGPALMLSKGIDRDRAVDESGNQLTVFNRRGSRPFNREEAQRMYMRNGQLYTVQDTPPGPPR